MIICLCQSDPTKTIPSGSKSIHPDPIPIPDAAVTMRCIKTGSPTLVSGRDYEHNCDIYMCVHCGCRIASL